MRALYFRHPAQVLSNVSIDIPPDGSVISPSSPKTVAQQALWIWPEGQGGGGSEVFLRTPNNNALNFPPHGRAALGSCLLEPSTLPWNPREKWALCKESRPNQDEESHFNVGEFGVLFICGSFPTSASGRPFVEVFLLKSTKKGAPKGLHAVSRCEGYDPRNVRGDLQKICPVDSALFKPTQEGCPFFPRPLGI